MIAPVRPQSYTEDSPDFPVGALRSEVGELPNLPRPGRALQMPNLRESSTVDLTGEGRGLVQADFVPQMSGTFSSNISKAVDKSMDVSRSTSHQSTLSSNVSEVSVDLTGPGRMTIHDTEVTCDWMFADAGTGVLGVSPMIPLRWSGPVSLDIVIAALEAAQTQRRPILLKIPANTRTPMRFETPQAAIAHIQTQASQGARSNPAGTTLGSTMMSDSLGPRPMAPSISSDDTLIVDLARQHSDWSVSVDLTRNQSDFSVAPKAGVGGTQQEVIDLTRLR